MNADKKEFSEEIAENIISRQFPAQNSVIKRADTKSENPEENLEENLEVMVVISLGKEKASLPSVVGLDYEEAVKALNEAGFAAVKEEESRGKGYLIRF